MTFSPANWITAIDIDFTTLSSQTFASDTNYTIGGLTWTKINSANERTASNLTTGVGITFFPAATGDYFGATRTLPALFTNISSLINGFNLGTPLRVWMYNSADNSSANFDQVMVAVERPASSTNVYVKRGFDGSASLYTSANFNGSNSGQAINTTAGIYNNNVLLLEIRHGLLGFDMRHTAGVYSNGFPNASALTSVGDYLGATGVGNLAPMGAPADWSILIGAHRAGGTNTNYTTTIARLKVEYKI